MPRLPPPRRVRAVPAAPAWLPAPPRSCASPPRTTGSWVASPMSGHGASFSFSRTTR
uniref:RAD5 n=1 Tax=Arundo donax TaxID=35708 RepID=A0A0A9GER5_ARUDO